MYFVIPFDYECVRVWSVCLLFWIVSQLVSSFIWKMSVSGDRVVLCFLSALISNVSVRVC